MNNLLQLFSKFPVKTVVRKTLLTLSASSIYFTCYSKPEMSHFILNAVLIINTRICKMDISLALSKSFYGSISSRPLACCNQSFGEYSKCPSASGVAIPLCHVKKLSSFRVPHVVNSSCGAARNVEPLDEHINVPLAGSPDHRARRFF